MARPKKNNATNTTMKVSRDDLIRWRRAATRHGFTTLREAIDEGLAILDAEHDVDAKLGRDVRARVDSEREQ